MDLCQTHGKQVPDFSCAWGHVVRFGHVLRSGLVMGFTQLNQLPIKLAHSSSYLRVYMGCVLAIVFQVYSLYIP